MKPTEYTYRHTQDFIEPIKKYILPYSQELAEELMDKVFEVYEKIGYPPREKLVMYHYDKITEMEE